MNLFRLNTAYGEGLISLDGLRAVYPKDTTCRLKPEPHIHMFFLYTDRQEVNLCTDANVSDEVMQANRG